MKRRLKIDKNLEKSWKSELFQGIPDDSEVRSPTMKQSQDDFCIQPLHETYQEETSIVKNDDLLKCPKGNADIKTEPISYPGPFNMTPTKG